METVTPFAEIVQEIAVCLVLAPRRLDIDWLPACVCELTAVDGRAHFADEGVQHVGHHLAMTASQKVAMHLPRSACMVSMKAGKGP